MKKIYLFFIIFLTTLTSLSCTSSSRLTSKKIVIMIESLEMDEVNQDFYQALNDYDYRGDAYYLLGEENEYIELIMYYKQKYVQVIFAFDLTDQNGLLVENVYVEYIDLLDEIYINFDAYDSEAPYVLDDKTYDDFFNDLEDLSISDIEWILESLNLM
ncbi:MAG: hypothetical protein ACOC2U_03965 [bacterium]